MNSISKIKYVQNIKKWRVITINYSVIFSSRAIKEYLCLIKLILNLVQYLGSDKDQNISKSDVGP